MLKRFAILFLVLAPALYGQTVAEEFGTELTTGKSAALGVEASTAFAWDIDNNTTGLQSKAGIELIFPLFANADRGMSADNFDEPAVRMVLKNAAFTWWNTYETRGGNYEQDNFNRWQARPLVLSFDSFCADVVWTNYFFRVASSTTVMRSDETSLFSIFDDVMDVNDRWYYRRSATRALWHTERYNIQDFPLLKEKIVRDYIDEDYRGNISGILAIGAEFDKFNAALKAASNKSGLENTDNAWLFGIDAEIIPVENFKIALTGIAGLNYEKTTVKRNPMDFGVSAEYRLSLSDRYFLTPKAGYDATMDIDSGNVDWEIGAGLLFHTRGYDFTSSSRILDWDDVIPVGVSASMNMNQDSGLNVMVSWFEPAGPEAMLPNFGGFLQLELANLLEVHDTKSAFAVLAQLEYMIAGKFTPYVRGGYAPVFSTGSNTSITGDYFVKAAFGCFMTPIHFFSVDIRYETDLKLLDSGDTETGKNLFSLVFTIRM
ncbi:MAG: hypothetical protein LBG91_04195 [Treponema sp.]|nr:hypothetical protein [Treponema sp.]